MPRPSQETTILAAALACFAELGYDATRVRQIAERAGVSEGALYRHYRSKEALAEALFIRYLGAYSARLAAIIGGEGSVRDRLEEAIRATLAFYRENPAAVSFVLLRQPGFAHRLPPGVSYPLEQFERLVQAGQAEGSVRAGPPSLLAAIALGCVLRPIIVAQLASPGGLDLLSSSGHDLIIAAAAWSALARPEAPAPPAKQP